MTDARAALIAVWLLTLTDGARLQDVASLCESLLAGEPLPECQAVRELATLNWSRSPTVGQAVAERQVREGEIR